MSKVTKKFLGHTTPEGARTTGRAFLTVGLLSAAIKLYKATDDYSYGFNMLHRGCDVGVHQKLVCPKCKKDVERKDICKGYEHDKEKWIAFEEAELDADAPENERKIEVIAFCKASEVAYVRNGNIQYVGADPEQPSDAYRVLFAAVAKSGKVAVVDYVMRGSEHRAVLEADSERGIFVLHDLFYSDQVRAASGIPRPLEPSASTEELALAKELIASMDDPVESLPNPNKARREAFITNLLKRVNEPDAKPASTGKVTPIRPAIDLMATLKASLAAKATKGKKTKAA